MNFLKKAQQQASNIQGGATKPAVPGAKPTIPGAKPTIPGSKPTVPGIKPSVPGAKPGLPKKPVAPSPVKSEESPLVAKENPFKKPVQNKAQEIAAKIDAEIPDVEGIEVANSVETTTEITGTTAETTNGTEAPEVETEVETKVKDKVEPQVEVEEQVDITKDEEIAKPVEAEEKPKKKSTRSRAKKKAEPKEAVTASTSDVSIETTEEVVTINPMVKTEVDFTEAVLAIKSSFVDEEWEAFREDVIQRLNDINISSDMNTVALRSTVADLVALRESIWVQYNDTKSIYEKLTAKEPEGLIERIKKLNSKGSNDAERKTNAINAVINYKDESGRKINLFELLDETRERYNFLKSVMDTSQYKTNVLVTMLGGLKLEK